MGIGAVNIGVASGCPARSIKMYIGSSVSMALQAEPSARKPEKVVVVAAMDFMAGQASVSSS